MILHPACLMRVITLTRTAGTWVVVKIMVPRWIPITIRHLISGVPKKGTRILTTAHMDSI